MAVGLRNYQKRILIVRGLVLLFLVVVVFLAMSVYTRFSIEREMSARREEAVREESTLRAREAEVRARVEYLSRENSKEAEIRKHFDVALEGEQVVILLDETATSTIEPLTAPLPVIVKPWYQFWR